LVTNPSGGIIDHAYAGCVNFSAAKAGEVRRQNSATERANVFISGSSLDRILTGTINARASWLT
jgi:hypothetical protein